MRGSGEELTPEMVKNTLDFLRKHGGHDGRPLSEQVHDVEGCGDVRVLYTLYTEARQPLGFTEELHDVRLELLLGHQSEAELLDHWRELPFVAFARLGWWTPPEKRT